MTPFIDYTESPRAIDSAALLTAKHCRLLRRGGGRNKQQPINPPRMLQLSAPKIEDARFLVAKRLVLSYTVTLGLGSIKDLTDHRLFES